MLIIFVDDGIIIGWYTIMAKPIKSLELHYPMIQFLMKMNSQQVEEFSGIQLVFIRNRPRVVRYELIR